MFIDSPVCKGPSLQRSENLRFDVLIHQYIALRWSAKHELVADSINIWLLWSQNIVYIRKNILSLEIDGTPVAKPERQAHSKHSPSALPPGSH